MAVLEFFDNINLEPPFLFLFACLDSNNPAESVVKFISLRRKDSLVRSQICQVYGKVIVAIQAYGSKIPIL